MNNYEEVRKTLCDMLEELGDKLGRITDDVKHVNEPLEKDFAEQASQHENDEVLDYLGNAARKEMESIKQALIRIDKGEYGQCVICGQDINPERLKIIPFSTICVNCANKSANG
jgi:RNA polymerase-binding transcription factor DksA